MEELKKIFLAGVGLTSTSVEKAEKLISELVEKGRVTVQEGKELQSELTRKVTDKRPIQKSELDDLGYAKKEDLDEVHAKLDAVSAQLEALLNK